MRYKKIVLLEILEQAAAASNERRDGDRRTSGAIRPPMLRISDTKDRIFLNHTLHRKTAAGDAPRGFFSASAGVLLFVSSIYYSRCIACMLLRRLEAPPKK